MKTSTDRVSHDEFTAGTFNGWLMLTILLLTIIACIGIMIASRGEAVAVFLLAPVIAVLLCGFFTLQPNEGRVLTLFGKYKGTVRTSGIPLDQSAKSKKTHLPARPQSQRRTAESE